LEMPAKRLTKFLYTIEAVGAIFAGVFLVAYLGGLFVVPQTTVFHSELALKIPLFVFGAVFLELIISAVVVAVLVKRQ
jgi:hypothetical protein